MKKKKQAFTLTELLVVVVVIGTLAAVTLPKFTKVLETRKTTEAEGIMQAIRTEQEARCALDKNYATSMSDLVAGPTSESANYTYVLANAGVEAQSTKGYTLKIPSYANGSICCTGEYCDKLNKTYPQCEELKLSAENVRSDNACSAEPTTVPEPGPEPDPECTMVDKSPQSCTSYKNDGKEWLGTVTFTINATCDDYDVHENCQLKVCTNGEKEYSNEWVSCDKRKYNLCIDNKWEERTETYYSQDCTRGCGRPADTTAPCGAGLPGNKKLGWDCDPTTKQWVQKDAWDDENWDVSECDGSCSDMYKEIYATIDEPYGPNPEWENHPHDSCDGNDTDQYSCDDHLDYEHYKVCYDRYCLSPDSGGGYNPSGTCHDGCYPYGGYQCTSGRQCVCQANGYATCIAVPAGQSGNLSDFWNTLDRVPYCEDHLVKVCCPPHRDPVEPEEPEDP